MNTLHFSIAICAPRSQVWQIMLAPETFCQWTAAFASGSYFEGSWDEGAEIRFLTPDGSGMLSRVAENRNHEFISIMHFGLIDKGKVDTESPQVKAWAPAFENYQLKDQNGGTLLEIAMDTSAEYEATMQEAWPKALEQLKALCEAA